MYVLNFKLFMLGLGPFRTGIRSETCWCPTGELTHHLQGAVSVARFKWGEEPCLMGEASVSALEGDAGCATSGPRGGAILAPRESLFKPRWEQAINQF